MTLRPSVSEGDRHRYLVVMQVLTGSEAGRPLDGAWVLVRCVCGKRRYVRARQFRKIASCGCKHRFLSGTRANRKRYKTKEPQ